MDPHYAMAKFGLESKDILRSRQKGCWHYAKYFFIFSSIIQFLIILGLVLFMLYGNAHGGTEHRLRSVENRYKNLTLDYLWLQGNFSMLKGKLTSAEKQHQNCSQYAQNQAKQIDNMNRSIAFLKTQMSPDCKRLQVDMERLNITCSNDKLQFQNYRFRSEAEYRLYKDNCNKSINNLAIKEQISAAEMKRLQDENMDQRKQFRVYQDSCPTIEQRFKNEIENMKKSFDSNLRGVNHYDSYGTSYKCRALSDSVSNSIDHSISRLEQELRSIILENSQLKATQGRTSDDLKTCNQDKEGLTEERNKLTAENSGIQKQLTDKENDLSRAYTQYMKKLDELETCQKMPFSRYPIRP